MLYLYDPDLKERSPDYENSILVVVNKKNKISIDDQIYSLKSLAGSLKGNASVWKKSLPVYLQMDDQVPYGILIEIMLLFKNAGFRQVGLVIKQDF